MTLLKRTLLSTSMVSALALGAVNANAAGFYIQEQSVSGLGSAFSGSTTTLTDPSTIYFNPANMTRINGAQAQFATHLLVPNSELTDKGSTAVGGASIVGNNGGNPYDPTPVPNGFVSYQVNDSLWVGAGVTAPFGLENEYDENWFGRFDSVKTYLRVFDIQPTIAYKINDMVSIAAGLNIQHAEAELTNASQAPAVFGQPEGVSTLEGDSVDYGYTLGLSVQPIEPLRLGVSYRSAISHELEGSIKTEGAGTANFDVSGQADLNLPDVLTVGASYDIDEKWTVMGQATHFGWDNFKDITATTDETFSVLGGLVSRGAGATVSSVRQGYEDTWAYAIGAEYKASDLWTLRAGMQFDETPTTDEFRTSRTPDGDRTWLSGGATYNVNDSLALDLAATYIWISDEDIDLKRNNAFSTLGQTDVKASTEGNVGIFALGVTYKF